MKQWISVVLTIGLALGLTGCGGEKTPAGSQNVEQVQTHTPIPAPEGNGDKAEAGDVLTVPW